MNSTYCAGERGHQGVVVVSQGYSTDRICHMYPWLPCHVTSLSFNVTQCDPKWPRIVLSSCTAGLENTREGNTLTNRV